MSSSKKGGGFGGVDDPDGLRPGDEKCFNCLGMTFLTNQMREKGIKPVCFGIKSVSKQPLPRERVLDLNKRTKKQDLGLYVAIGYTRWSGLMDRTGRIPICERGGVLFLFSEKIIPKQKKSEDEQEQEQEQKQEKEAQEAEEDEQQQLQKKVGGYLHERERGARKNEEKVVTPPPHVPAVPSATSPLNALVALGTLFPLAVKSFSKDMKPASFYAGEFYRMMKKGTKKQAHIMYSFFASTTKNLPSKMYKASNTLAASSVKMSKKIYKKLFGGGGGSIAGPPNAK